MEVRAVATASPRQRALPRKVTDKLIATRLALVSTNGRIVVAGETVTVQVSAETSPVSGSSKTHTCEDHDQITKNCSQQRWCGHCEGAQVQIQIVEVSKKDLHASNSHPSFTTLFRQETQLFHVSVDDSENKNEFVVMLKAQFDLKIRRDCWGRKLLLIVHITPKSSVVEAPGGGEKLGLLELNLTTTSVLRDEWATSQLLSLTRKQAEPTPVMTRRVEQLIVVTKPLQLKIESRELPGRRVGILARVFNTHSSLVLAVRDLHLHLDQSLRQNELDRDDATRFSVVSGDKVPFPVMLQPQESYNFLYVLEPVEVTKPHESPEEKQDNVDQKQVKRKTLKKPKPRELSLHHSLVTLSWQANAVPMGAITENRTIVWSPMRSVSSLSIDDKWQDDVQKLLTHVLAANVKEETKPSADFHFVRLLQNSVLQVTMSPLLPSISVGTVVTVCVKVSNRSARVDFDLTLVLPRVAGHSSAVVGFEASHRLGLLRLGTSIERGLHVVFLCSGKCRLGPLVLVDHLTCTCFVSDAWEVFVKN